MLLSFVWRSVLKWLEPDIGVNKAHHPSAVADVKEIDFHKDQNFYKHMERWIWVGKYLFIDYEKNYLQLEKENWKVFDRYVILSDDGFSQPSYVISVCCTIIFKPVIGSWDAK